MKIVVTRAFLAGGKRQEVGDSLELPDHIARELIATNKAQRAPDAPPEAPPGPLTTETASAVVAGKPKKEPHHARQ